MRFIDVSDKNVRTEASALSKPSYWNYGLKTRYFGHKYLWDVRTPTSKLGMKAKE